MKNEEITKIIRQNFTGYAEKLELDLLANTKGTFNPQIPDEKSKELYLDVMEELEKIVTNEVEEFNRKLSKKINNVLNQYFTKKIIEEKINIDFKLCEDDIIDQFGEDLFKKIDCVMYETIGNAMGLLPEKSVKPEKVLQVKVGESDFDEALKIIPKTESEEVFINILRAVSDKNWCFKVPIGKCVPVYTNNMCKISGGKHSVFFIDPREYFEGIYNENVIISKPDSPYFNLFGTLDGDFSYLEENGYAIGTKEHFVVYLFSVLKHIEKNYNYDLEMLISALCNKGSEEINKIFFEFDIPLGFEFFVTEGFIGKRQGKFSFEKGECFEEANVFVVF